MTTTLTRIDGSRAEVHGDLLNDTVPAVLPEGSRLLAVAGDSWTVDLAGVGKVSSAGVAMLLEWMRVAAAAGVALHIANLPEHMRPIISVSDLEPLFEPLLV